MPNYYEEISVIELQNRLQKGMPVTGNVAFNNGNKAALQIEPLMTTEIERYRTGSYALVSFSHIIPEWATNPLVIDQQPAQIQEGNSIDIFSNLNATVGVSADIADKLGYKHTMRFFRKNHTVFSPQIYPTGWKGGSKSNIKTYKVTRVVGGTTFFLGIVFDYAKYKNGETGLGKLLVNTTVSTIGLLGGPIGFTISTIYWVLDTLGAFESHSPLPMQRKDPAMLPKDNLKIVLPVNYKPQPTLKRVYSPKQIYIHPMPPKHY